MANDLLCGPQPFCLHDLPLAHGHAPPAQHARAGTQAHARIENWISPLASQWFWQPDSDAVSEEECPDMAVSSGLKRQFLTWVKEVAFFSVAPESK